MESLRRSIQERAKHKQENDKSTRTESEKHDTSSKFENDTHVEDVDIKPTNDKEPMAETTLQSLLLKEKKANHIPQQPCISPPRDDWDRLFQPMFYEHFTPPSIVVSLVQEVTAPRAVVLAESYVSTSIDQDAPSTSTSSTQEQEQSLNIFQGFEESPKTPIFHDDPLYES
nr:hypothetical protein [Tanacetum cinerariifolium]